MTEKCESCRRAFFQSGGYMPCSCKAVVARKLTNEEKSDFRKKIEQDLIDKPLYSKRMQIEPRPKYVEPPSLVPIGQSMLVTTHHSNFGKLILLILIMLCLLGFGFALGCLYATSYLP